MIWGDIIAIVFEKKHLELVDHGLADTKVFVTIKSKVDGSGKGRLYYSGYDLNEIADRSSFEEITYLLHNDRLPSRQELDEFSGKIAKLRKLSKETVEIIEKVKDDEPMAMLRTAVSTLSAHKPDPENEAIDLIAKFPSIIAAVERIKKGKKIVEPDGLLSTAENFIYMLTGEKPDKGDAKILDLLLIVLADHGMNASTFTARLVTSTGSDIYSAITAAIGALKGPLHGGANQGAMDMLEEIQKTIESDDLKEIISKTESWVESQLEKKKVIMGIGHRVYKGGDPRAALIKSRVEEIIGKDDKHFVIAKTVEDTMKRLKGLSANVDLYSGMLYSRIGIPDYLFTSMFAMSRIAGWTAHVLEQRANNRLLRPKGVYLEELSPLGKKYVPIDKR